MSTILSASNGIYQTEYAFERVTVRLFESPELMGKDGQSVFQALVTYAKEGETPRQEIDTLTAEQRDYCRKEALALEKANGWPPFSERFKGLMAQVYWTLIQ